MQVQAMGDREVLLPGYDASVTFDEAVTPEGLHRDHCEALLRYFASLDANEIAQARERAAACILEMGITFRVYSQEEGALDRAWPLDIIPRIIAASEWRRIAKGLRQRVRALNLFVNDLYNEQQIIADGIFPGELVLESSNFRKECLGVRPPHGVWAHICGSDLVRDADGQMYVLEDNLRVPSGVSYMLENRQVIKRVLPDLFDRYGVLPVDNYAAQLFETLCSVAPEGRPRPEIVVLTPGVYNSAYFEHAYLAQQMGCELVEGRDLFVDDDDTVHMRTVSGPARVDVIYRRIDDLFLDPEVFDRGSMLGVPGLMRAWKSGKVAMVNAPGAGVADDKAVYAYVPQIIRYYLGEEAILPNVPTHLCNDPESRAYVLDHLEELVVKPVNESGGYGLLMGPRSTAEERAACAERIRAHPRNYIAQPVLGISTVPTLTGDDIEARHVDLRPFILSGRRMYVTTGGLTRVALRRGSLVVNSSQGGGSKDTWVVEEG